MSEYKWRIISFSAIAVILAVSISLGIAYLPQGLGGNNSSTFQVPSYILSSLKTSTQTTNSTLGLEFALSINSTEMRPGEVLNITDSISNILPKVNDVSGASNWALQTLQNFSSEPFPCPSYASFQIFQGHYTSANISSAGPLQLYPSGIGFPSCPLLQRPYFLFQPSSNLASVFLSPQPNFNITFRMGGPSYIRGNYSAGQCVNISAIGQVPIPPTSTPPFSSGVYTIAAGDEWGQLAILYFVVTNSPQTLSSSSRSTTCSG